MAEITSIYGNKFVDEKARQDIAESKEQIQQNTNDVSNLKEELSEDFDKLISQRYAVDATEYKGYIGGLYLRDNGTVGVDSNNNAYIIPCAPNTTYMLERTQNSGKCGIGYSIGQPEQDAPLLGFEKTAGNVATVTTSGVADTLMWYIPKADSDYYKVYEVTFRNQIDRIEMKMEGGALPSGKTSYSKEDHTRSKRSAYMIKAGGASRISLEFKDGEHVTTFYFYDAQYNVLGYTDVLAIASHRIKGVTPPANTAYVRFVVSGLTDNCVGCILYGCSSQPQTVKNAKMRDATEWLTFDVDVTSGVFTCARMLLPPNYTIDGDKVPLILYLDGSGNFTNWNSDFSPDKKPYLLYLRDEGFAVLSVFGWGNHFSETYPACGMAYPYPTPTPLACVRKGVEWVCDRYNIDYNNIHIMSKSQGGQCALYYASRHDFPVKSIGMFSPVVDYLSMPGEEIYGDARKAIYDDIGLVGDKTYFGGASYLSYSDEGIAFWANNKKQLCQLNEKWTRLVGGTLDSRFASASADAKKFWEDEYWSNPSLTDIYTHHEYAIIADTPVKIWGAPDDASTPYLAMVEVVDQLNNGGCEAHMRSFPTETGGHQCADGGSTVVASITTALGITYTNMPIGWVENIEWIRLNMAK